MIDAQIRVLIKKCVPLRDTVKALVSAVNATAAALAAGTKVTGSVLLRSISGNKSIHRANTAEPAMSAFMTVILRGAFFLPFDVALFSIVCTESFPA